jgi:RNA polymerase sigma factor (sigma-70 family)
MDKQNKLSDIKDLQASEGCPSFSEVSESLQRLTSPANSVPDLEKENKKAAENGIELARRNRTVLERELMIKENLPLVYFFAKRMANAPYHNHQDFEDLVSEGTEGLIKAVDNRDPGKSEGEWRVYLAICIRASMSRHLHKSRHRAIEVEEDMELEDTADKSLELLDFYEMIDMLEDKRQRDLLIDKYVYGRNCADMGRERGLSRERTRQIVIQGEETLKKRLTNLDS